MEANNSPFLFFFRYHGLALSPSYPAIVTDMLVIAKQENLITQEQSMKLAQMLGNYENSNNKRSKT